MSYIPQKAMHHAQVDADRVDLDEGKIAPRDQGDTISAAPKAEGEQGGSFSWVLGAAGAGVAVAAAAAAYFSLRSSTPTKPVRRRAPRKTAAKATKVKTAASAAKPATPRRRGPGKKTAASAA